MRTWLKVAAVVAATWFGVNAVSAAAPRIANVYPDFAGRHLRAWDVPHLITGEGFGEPDVEVWVWSPPKDDPAEPVFRPEAYDDLPELPQTPPDGARRVGVLSREGRILLAPLRASAVVWVRNADGYSRPYMLNVARPFWISHEHAAPGDVLHLFGFGLRVQYATTRLVLRSNGRTIEIEPSTNPRGMRDKDPRLVYFRLPRDMEEGTYQLYVHNGYGGAYGWRYGGDVEVAVRTQEKRRVFNVTEYGAQGDDMDSDLEAIQQALADAEAADGGVVFFPPGLYRVERTLDVPKGVTLRGAEHTGTVIEGFGYHPSKTDRNAWYSSDPIPASVLMLTSRTGLERLTITGYVAEGNGGHAMVEAYPDADNVVKDVTVRDCRFVSTAVHPEYGTLLYRAGWALRIWPESRRIRVVDNHFKGGIVFSQTHRTEVVDNKVTRGGISGKTHRSLLDGNIFSEAPSRVLFYPVNSSYIRYNEVHGYFRDSWNNAPEPFLTHGAGAKLISTPTAADANTLTDQTQDWQPGEHQGQVVLISAGRGFGQFRRVVDNSSDTLDLDRPWRVAPDADSEYVLGRFHHNSAYYANSLSDSPGVLSLWLDCVNMVVERYRTEAAGANVWGRDLAQVDGDGGLKNARRFEPSWYNMFVNNWFDGSRLDVLGQVEHASSPTRGPALFGTYVIGNRFVESHQERIPHDHVVPRAKGGIVIDGTARYTVAADNFLSFTNIGISVAEDSRKTVLQNNEFQQVERPIVDRGLRTISRQNKVFRFDEQQGEHYEELEDYERDRDTDYRRPRPPQTQPAEGANRLGKAREPGPFEHRAHWIRSVVSYIAYEVEDIRSEQASQQCQQNLTQLYRLIRAYDTEHGHLPDAAFYPPYPHTRKPGLGALFGDAADSYLRCPAAGSDMARLGWPSYIWNTTLSGKPLAQVEDPANTWLVMDVWGPHPFMISHQHAGHHGGVNVLFADGSVRWMESFDWSAWAAAGNKVAEQ
jgi:prepilin-type processing-associated H-X9-DG protein